MEEVAEMTTPMPSSPLVDDSSKLATILDTNSTEKYIPTSEGMACAYLSLMLMALVPILLGSFKSIKHQAETHTKYRTTGEQAETMTDKDAAIFPIIASCALFSFYILIKLSPDLVNLVVSGYFFFLGVFAILRVLQPITFRFFPTKYNTTQYSFVFGTRNLDENRSSEVVAQQKNDSSSADSRSGSTSPTNSSSTTSLDDDNIPSDIMIASKFTPSDILAFVLSAGFGIWYLMTKHWLANNAFGIAFALSGIELIAVNSVKIGCTLLWGLFFYDVFWVFCTDVMVSVAKKFDAPIKIIFPQDFLERGIFGKNYAMLGLGDIVIPGIYIAFLLRFDKSLNRGRNLYFWSCFLAYVFGLGITIGVMSYFKHAQPALLYLVPSCVLIPFMIAVTKGDFKALVSYRDHPQSESESREELIEHDETGDDQVAKKERSTRSISTRASSKKDK